MDQIFFTEKNTRLLNNQRIYTSHITAANMRYSVHVIFKIIAHTCGYIHITYTMYTYVYLCILIIIITIITPDYTS